MIEKLDSGSSIQTYLVKDLQHPSKLQCILKQITPPNEVGAFTSMHNLFTNAYLELQQLNTHPERQIANLIACFDEDEKFYIVQEFVAGHNLDLEINAESQWSEDKVVDLMIETLEFVEFVHALKLSHLNLRPSNIRRREHDGKLVLIDFGILKRIISSAGNPASEPQPQSLGTIGYVPAEGSGTFSELNLNIYATGMIGLQALTGIEPSNLSSERPSGEVIWRFSTLNHPGREISPELTKILDKMLAQLWDVRYQDIAQVLEALRHLRNLRAVEPPTQSRFRLLDQRLLVGAALSVVAIGVAGNGWNQHLFTVEKNLLIVQKNERLMQQCSQPLRSQKSGNRPLDAGLIAVAQKVEENCGQMLEQGKLNSSSKITVLKRRGEALLLLGKSSGDLGQKTDATNYLTNAQKNFQEAVTLDSNNPQVRFYLGLTKQLRKDGGFNKDYKAAIDLYLRGDSKQTQSVDYPILAKLTAYLPQQPGQTDYSPENFKNADQLYQKAIALTSDRSNQVNLSYNRGVLNYRNNKSVDAAKILSNVSGIDPKNPFSKQYLEKCIINSALNPSLCQPPSESNSVATNASLPFRLPVYSCQQYPSLAIAKLASGTPDELCQ